MALITRQIAAQNEWPVYGHDPGGMRYSPLKQLIVDRFTRTDIELPEADGKPVVVRICGKCHGVATFAQSRMSADEWRVEVADMVARGATGTPEELRTVVDYLAMNLAGPAGTRRPHSPR